MSKQKILVPIGFSSYSHHLVDYAVNLAKRIDGELHLVHGLEVPHSIESFCDERKLDEIRTNINQSLEATKKEITDKHPIDVITKLIFGRVYESILSYQNEHKIDYLVIGANGSDRLSDFIGANAFRVLRETYSPAITLKGDCKKTDFKDIVVPLDLTNEVNENIRKACQIAENFNDITLRLVCATPSKDEFVINRITRHMGQIKDSIAKDNISVSSEIITGINSKNEIASTLIDYARKVDADLIIIMTQKEKDPVKYYIGSIALQIMNQDEFPVMSMVP